MNKGMLGQAGILSRAYRYNAAVRYVLVCISSTYKEGMSHVQDCIRTVGNLEFVESNGSHLG